MSDEICVIIAAYNSSGTVARAVRSALVQPEVVEVVLVDDASTDATLEAARSADDGSGRLSLLAQGRNQGPAAARNFAIANSRAPSIAILDADDFFLEGRFAALLGEDENWDGIADNVLFVREATVGRAAALTSGGSTEGEPLDFSRFVRGNISRPGRYRGELGFLKPVISRAFLERHGLAYDERLRLGEDLDLYARMLACGARMGMTEACFYVAVERDDSISAKHDAGDLERLLAAMKRLEPAAPEFGREALEDLRSNLAARYHHRQFLLDKKTSGLSAAVGQAMHSPRRLLDAARGIARDKWNGRKRWVDAGPRLLVPASEWQ